MQKNVRPYEVLIRIHAGGLEAAHIMYVEEVIGDDGVLIAQRALPAQPLELAGEDFSTVIGHVNTTVLTERNALNAKNKALEPQLECQADLNAKLKVDLTGLREEIALLQNQQPEIDRLKKELSQLRAMLREQAPA